MPILINNDQNINRVLTKMSEDFSNKNANLSNCLNNIEFYEEVDVVTNDNDEDDDDQVSFSYDHMYASQKDHDDNTPPQSNCQNDESEVKFLKDWLLLHLDFIQQQNDEILDKERIILDLKEENEMLKERINCMEKGTPFQPKKSVNLNHKQTEQIKEEDFVGDNMTQNSVVLDEDDKSNIELIHTNCDNQECTNLNLMNYEENHLSDNDMQIDNCNQNNNSPVHELVEIKQEDYVVHDITSVDIKSESVVTDCNNSLTEFNCSIDNYSDFDPMRNIRMSIRRKRLCSNSSALSNNDSTNEEKRSYRKFKKKRRRFTKDSQILTTNDEYVTQAGDCLRISTDNDIPVTPDSTLEVPRWRVKLYASCYTMEGTENLDDEVYNKRHNRLETDERRRKRWDVQRIREQRVIEKLKQRQERVGSGSRNDEQNEPVQSLLPKIEDIKFLEISEELPVSAFGCQIPNIASSEFSLPWLENPAILNKKTHIKRKRKSTKR